MPTTSLFKTCLCRLKLMLKACGAHVGVPSSPPTYRSSKAIIALGAAAYHEFFDFADCLGGVEAFGAYVDAVHDAAAAE